VSAAPETLTLLRAVKAAHVLDLLRAAYGRSRRHHDGHPTDSLVATILSQHTADRNSSAAFVALKSRYTTWGEIAYADRGELATVIRPAGLANIKAQRIQDSLREVFRRYGTFDLSFLRAMNVSDARAVLTSLPGVGKKTASCVLLFACDLAVVPVDTHVHRVTRRVGLIGPRDSPDQAHDILEALVPADDMYDLHVDLIAHGRAICHARVPLCTACVLRNSCDYFAAGRRSSISVTV
jgi:endonuclease III